MSLTNEDKEWILAENAKLSREIAEVAKGTERVETALLTAFHRWPSPVESKLRSHREAIRALDQESDNSIDRERRLAELESRIRKLEKAS